MSSSSLCEKDKVILEQLLNDPDVKVDMGGNVWIKRTKRPPSGGAIVDEEGFRNVAITTKAKRKLVYYKGYMFSLSRIVFAAFNGTLDSSKEIIHRDKNPLNNSPDNLYEGDSSEGASLSLRKFKDEKTVIKIREEVSTGRSVASMAEELNSSYATIDNIVKGKTYKDFGGPILSDTANRTRRLGPNSSRSNLTPEQYEEIISERGKGISLSKLAERFPITSSGISRLYKREMDRRNNLK